MNAGTPRRGLGRGLGSLIPTGPPPGQSDAGSTATPGGDVKDGARDADFAAGAPNSAPVDPRPTGSAPGAQTPDPALTPVEGAYFAELPVTQILPNAVNQRTVFDEDAMGELVHSIKEIGLLQPVVVRRTGPESYELVMGERRWRATQQAGLTTIPAIVRETEDVDMLRDALLENLHRSNLNPLEEAAAYQQLLEDFSCTHEELAGRIGRSRPQISNTLRLLKLSPAVQRRVAAGVLSAGHARALLAVPDADQQDRLAQRVVAEGISVRALEEIVTVGELGGATPRPRRPKPKAPGLGELSERLGDRLETRVKIDLGKAKGRITIEFANTGDLQRIIDLIDPRNREDRPI